MFSIKRAPLCVQRSPIQAMHCRLSFDWTESHRHAGFGQAIHREHGVAPETRSGQQIAKPPHHLSRNRLRPIAQQTHARQIQLRCRKHVRTDAIQHMLQTEIRRTDHRRAIPDNLPQPEQRLGNEIRRRQLDLPHAAIQRHQMEGNQPHIMVIGHPAQRCFFRLSFNYICYLFDIAD